MTRETLVALVVFALRTFVLSAGLFGLCKLSVDAYRALDPESARDLRDEALRAGAFFGGWLTVLFVALGLPQWWRTRTAGGPQLRPSERLVLAMSREDAIDRCRGALADEVGVRRVRERGDVLRARAGVSWSTWGERLSIELTAIDGRRTHVRIAGEPLWRGTVVDYGKGRRRVDAIRDRLIRSDLPDAMT